MSSTRKPLLLCIHGGGTSGAIFHAQLRNIRSRLQDYEFIFVNAPREGPAGPGVLPLFANSGPYYWWFGAGWNRSTKAGSQAGSNDELQGGALMEDAVLRDLAAQGRSPRDVVGLMGFSEGALASTLLLWRIGLCLQRDYVGRPTAWQSLRFATLLCPGYRPDVVHMVGPESIQIPTVQLHGLHDPLLPGSRELMQCYRNDGNSRVLEFDGGHHVPTNALDLDNLVIAIRDADRKGLRKKARSTSSNKVAIGFQQLSNHKSLVGISVQSISS